MYLFLATSIVRWENMIFLFYIIKRASLSPTSIGRPSTLKIET